MENDCQVKHYDKVCGNCDVCWKIENFCLATCKENYEIRSSEFCVGGPEPTTWKLILVPRPPDCPSMRLTLERLSDSGPVSVSANWTLKVGSSSEYYYWSDYNHEFEKSTRQEIDAQHLSDVMLIFRPYDCDTLIIQCHLFVYHRDINLNLDKPKTLGLKCLTEDFGRMLHSLKDKDLVLQVDNKEILVHKAALSRNAVFEGLIHEANDNTIKITNLNSAAVRKYVKFLYTGDLDKILQNPSMSMYNCIRVLETDLLRCYFALETLTLHTKMKVEEFEHMWIIKNFSSRKEELLWSPLFEPTGMDSTWQLRMHFGGIDYYSIYADVVEGNKPSNACLEFAVQDVQGDLYHQNRILSSEGKYDSGIDEFVKKALLSRTSLVADDAINVAFKVRTWDGEHYTSSVGCRMTTFRTESEESSSYVQLSKSLLEVYRQGVNADVLIKAEDRFFEAHKCILSARSPVLSVMIKELGDEAHLVLNETAPRILGPLLEYIYCGVLLERDHQTLEMLLKAAETYKIFSLEQDCQQALLKSIEGQSQNAQ